MDYKAFLAPREPIVLPYFGGTRIDAADRRLRVDSGDAGAPLQPGWWRFRIDGRRAIAVEPATPPDLAAQSGLAVRRGHWCRGWVVSSGREVARIALPPDDEPAAFSRVTARRWYSGDWLFDAIDFEDEPELAARQALEDRRPLTGVRDVVPSLRAAFGVALGMAIARELDIAIEPRELVAVAAEIADGGREVVRALFDDLVEARRRAIEEVERRSERLAAARRMGDALRSAQARRRADDPQRRADDALDAAGARMLACRTVERGARLDVTYEVDGTRILSLVDADTLQVIDPGVCLAGAHRVLTLDAMPSVIREAIELDTLNITRS